MPPPLIETKRLLLTWPTPEQIAGHYAAIVGTNIFDTIVWDGPSDVQELHDWWSETASRSPSDVGLSLNMAVIERTSGRYIGGVSLRPVDGDPAVIDIGYAFAVDSHGKGYATEAVGALVDEAFGKRGAERIFGNVFVGNVGSRRVMEKLGFVHEGTQRRCACKRGVWRDQWMIAITRPDWESRQAGRS
ncbi:MAG: GNAT family protein [Myxococcota bacterium]|nr:GNAT family protein [Myxococcota bacterium]